MNQQEFIDFWLSEIRKDLEQAIVDGKKVYIENSKPVISDLHEYLNSGKIHTGESHWAIKILS